MGSLSAYMSVVQITEGNKSKFLGNMNGMMEFHRVSREECELMEREKLSGLIEQYDIMLGCWVSFQKMYPLTDFYFFQREYKNKIN